MFDERDDTIDKVIQQLRRPVAIDPALDARVMRAIAEDDTPRAAPRPTRRIWPWLVAAAAVAALIIAAPWRARRDRSDALQFVLVAPRAASVSLVGDFNDWDPARSPMHDSHGGIWATVVPLAPGHYRYAFLVDGVEWRSDPAAPAARDDEFGAPSSVVTVGGS